MSRRLDRSSQPCAVLDLERRLVRVNQAFEELVGYTAAELATMVPADITRAAGGVRVGREASR